jgi:hypothetical protein
MSKPKPITEAQLRARFPNASRSTLAVNAGNNPINPINSPAAGKSDICAHLAPGQASPVKIKKRRRRRMNKTETAFSLRLEAMRIRGEIFSWEFEGMTLRWGKDELFQYTPDFTVIVELRPPCVLLRFYEVKGAHIYPKDWNKFRTARDEFRNFEFEFHQCIKREWTRTS